jgi:hypothetical protein
METVMEIRKLGYNTFDIFMFTGWDSWSRVRVGKHGAYVNGGNKLSKGTLKDLTELLHKGFNPKHGVNYTLSEN